MLFATIIHINIKLNLFDLSQALWKNLCSMLLELVIVVSLSIRSEKSKFKTPRRNWTCSHHSEKLSTLYFKTKLVNEEK